MLGYNIKFDSDFFFIDALTLELVMEVRMETESTHSFNSIDIHVSMYQN